ncbi:MAG TPA: NAD(+)/NADH kinase [Terriglobales bacterium]|nr:NAD(+)/NADH kinase [Terriglobales bacterium]
MRIAPGAAIGIYTKPGDVRAPALVAELSAWLSARGYRPAPNADGSDPMALAVVLGGDGTMLHAARRLAPLEVPVLAVHLGTLGFLTETSTDNMFAALETVLAGGGARERRLMLHARLERGGKLTAEFEALNEVVAGKSGLARLQPMDLDIAGQSVGRYRADGILVATPTGSTAYSFSAGGPVVHPAVEALLVTPICPHALSQRPLVVSTDAEIVITVAPGADAAQLTIDGQQGCDLIPGDRILCTRSPHALTLVSAAPANFYHSLRQKLGWGR